MNPSACAMEGGVRESPVMTRVFFPRFLAHEVVFLRDSFPFCHEEMLVSSRDTRLSGRFPFWDAFLARVQLAIGREASNRCVCIYSGFVTTIILTRRSNLYHPSSSGLIVWPFSRLLASSEAS